MSNDARRGILDCLMRSPRIFVILLDYLHLHVVMYFNDGARRVFFVQVHDQLVCFYFDAIKMLCKNLTPSTPHVHFVLRGLKLIMN